MNALDPVHHTSKLRIGDSISLSAPQVKMVETGTGDTETLTEYIFLDDGAVTGRHRVLVYLVPFPGVIPPSPHHLSLVYLVSFTFPGVFPPATPPPPLKYLDLLYKLPNMLANASCDIHGRALVYVTCVYLLASLFLRDMRIPACITLST